MANTKANQLKKWFIENGGHLNDAIEMVRSLEYGYHYVAYNRTIGPAETVCKCPLSLTLSHLNVMPESAVGVRNNSSNSICSRLIHNPRIDRSTIAIFFLAEQRLKSKDSFWFPYIQLLPSEADMTTPPWFTDQELLYLRGTNLLSNDTPPEQTSINRQKIQLREKWALGVSELEGAGEPTHDLTWELFLWAATIFSSRSFTSDLFTTENGRSPFPVLYPAMDIFSHRIGTKATWRFQNGDFSLHLEEKVEEGQQIFNNYSPKGNEELLMGFGFCVTDNPYDRVALRLGKVSPETHRLLRESIPNHWQSENWDDQESVFFIGRNLQDTLYDSSKHRVQRLNCLRGIPWELTKSVYAIILQHNQSSTTSNEISDNKTIWEATVEVLLHQIETSLHGITRWDRELPKSPPTPGAKAALIYREGQVKILEEVASSLREFLSSLQLGEVSVEEDDLGAEEIGNEHSTKLPNQR